MKPTSQKMMFTTDHHHASADTMLYMWEGAGQSYGAVGTAQDGPWG
jgi:hypothetical protein